MKQKEPQILTIEQRVAAAILDKPVDVLYVDGKVFKISQPSIGTLIEASQIISTMPVMRRVRSDKMIATVLKQAKDYKALGELAAVLILGRKNLTEIVDKTVDVPDGGGIGKILGWTKKERRKVEVDKKAELAQIILDNVRPSVLWNVVLKRLKDLEVGDFFGITTSLCEANLLKPTRDVD